MNEMKLYKYSIVLNADALMLGFNVIFCILVGTTDW